MENDSGSDRISDSDESELFNGDQGAGDRYHRSKGEDAADPVFDVTAFRDWIYI